MGHAWEVAQGIEQLHGLPAGEVTEHVWVSQARVHEGLDDCGGHINLRQQRFEACRRRTAVDEGISRQGLVVGSGCRRSCALCAMRHGWLLRCSRLGAWEHLWSASSPLGAAAPGGLVLLLSNVQRSQRGTT